VESERCGVQGGKLQIAGAKSNSTSPNPLLGGEGDSSSTSPCPLLEGEGVEGGNR